MMGTEAEVSYVRGARTPLSPAHPSGWTTKDAGLSHGTRTPPFFWDDPRQDVELAAGSSFTTSRKSCHYALS